MSARYFLELLSRSGELEHRQVFDSLPIRIGRAYDNDCILDDPHTAAHHAQIELNEQGNLQIRDLDSKNGLTYQNRRHSTLELDGNRVIRLGQTFIRVRDRHFVVEPEVLDANNYRWEGWRPALAAFLLIVFQSVVTKWMSQSDAFSFTVYAQYTIGMLLFALVWSGLWAGANRLFARHPRFGRHLFIAASGILAMQVCAIVATLAGFIFSWEVLPRYRSHTQILCMGFMIYFHLVTISTRASRRKLWAVMFCAALASGTVLMSKYKNTGSFGDDLYMGDLFSPSLRLSKDISIDEFSKEAEQLKEKLDKERRDPSAGAEEDDE
nr:FHA domain-containing protein [uncultured Undibacterium sp.]